MDQWTEPGADKKLSARELRELLRRRPGARPAGARRAPASEGQTLTKAKLVAQGRLEDESQIRAGAPTGSRDALHFALAASAEI